ncbi:UvrD-helicase domain-containing protein [Solirubrobacter soli]|uniref:UvrD-helicase domain-containing protein n=1 Tax=Solirubrobacter soli TaxID=363832 RepID=UPI0003FD5DE8|nr:UvrD-helicase domain-containing protein [Solirubrobacter soli]
MSRAFDICGPLPTGITVLEASAGTGKTYTIAGLAARYVAEGTPLDQLLLVTFTRMATGELRDRVRERLVTAERELGLGVASDDVVSFLLDAPSDVVAERRARLLRALADFDSATIATTHGFCQEVLSGIGVAGDMEPDAEVVEDVGDLLGEVVDDLYVRKYMDAGDPQITRAEAMQIAREVVENPGSPIEPRDAGGDSLPALRARLAGSVRVELDRRKRALSVITYDDLLTRLRDELAGRRGSLSVARLQDRYRVVLVDEFQDTDPIQWEILQRAFGGGGVTLVLIGDPKQAIYAFRGADVYSYLEAKQASGETATLELNRRSDQALIDAYDAMFGGAKLGHPDIVYGHVRAAGARDPFPIPGAPLRVRVVDRADPAIEKTRQGYAGLNSARQFVAKDLAADLVRVLSGVAAAPDGSASPGGPVSPGGSVSPGGPASSGGPTAPAAPSIKPGDIAVLVRYNRHAVAVRDALDDVGIPSVINGAGSVFATPAAREWLRLLEALERPASPVRARAATMTSFLGWTAEQIASADDAAWEEVHRRLHAWAAVLRRRGLASLIETITLVERLPGRVLGVVDGERRLTDLRHVGQLLHGASAAEKLGVAALAVWLRQRIATAETEGDEERSRRLESDAAAVQVLTIHRSKGLEFPVVYVPYLWEPTWVDDKPVPIVYHDRAAGFRRTIDVGLAGSDYKRHKDWYIEEQRGEDLRLAYVALTRARHQAVLWWAASWNSKDSALSRLLFARDGEGNVAPSGPRPPSDEAAIARFRELAGAAPGCVSVEPTTRLGLPVAWSGPPRDATTLTAAVFDRTLDRDWRRTSYSDITAAAHEARVSSEPEEATVTDEPDDDDRPSTLPPFAAPPATSPAAADGPPAPAASQPAAAARPPASSPPDGDAPPASSPPAGDAPPASSPPDGDAPPASSPPADGDAPPASSPPADGDAPPASSLPAGDAPPASSPPADDGALSLFSLDDPPSPPARDDPSRARDDSPIPAVPPAPRDDAALAAVPAILAAGPGGTEFGTFVHTVFESTDFAAPDLDAELVRTVAAALARGPVEIGDRATVVAGLRAAIETPLGPLVGNLRLRDIARVDRLDELTFELPLVGGDEPTGELTPGAIAKVLREHLPPGDPLAGYANRLEDPAIRASVRGYLTGSIDLVVRIGEGFAIADYKTNWLAAPGEELSAWHHRPEALTAEMEHAHYGLQALLYTAALHRYLRWRLRGYDPARHLAGVLYLFVRGMTGPGTPTVAGQPCGVFAWRPPAPLVVALSDVLDRGTA